MPIFSWNANLAAGVVNHRLWVYFAVMVPLTIVTLVSWRVWSQLRNSEDDKRRAEVRQC